jgi:hypothetical protein
MPSNWLEWLGVIASITTILGFGWALRESVERRRQEKAAELDKRKMQGKMEEMMADLCKMREAMPNLEETGEAMKRLVELIKRLSKPDKTTGDASPPAPKQPNDSPDGKPSDKVWLEKQKKRTQEICESHTKTCRIIYRKGVAVQSAFGQIGPVNLIPKNPNEEDLTVWLMTEGCEIYRVIAFYHSDISKLPLRWCKLGDREPFQTMTLDEFEKFRGKYCFVSFEDFENGFAW